MPGVVVLGEASRVSTWALSGAAVLTAEDPDEVRDAWARLAPDVGVVLLTGAAAAALADGPQAPGRPDERTDGAMTVVLP